jgi:hypothetical protein
MGAVAQPLSPELALVCPELRAHALELLPAIDPDALFAVTPERVAKVIPLRPVAAVVPDRRRAGPAAVAAYVAEAVVLGALRATAMIAVIACLAYLLSR